MIPMNIDDKDVLRRTLLELEDKVTIQGAPLSSISKVVLDGANDLQLLANKVNEIGEVLNSLSNILNRN